MRATRQQSFCAARRMPVVAKLRDQQGASMIIALTFFLVCAIVGSIVLTAASVSAQQVATQKQSAQANYAVSSAARVVGAQLQGGRIDFAYDTKAAAEKPGDTHKAGSVTNGYMPTQQVASGSKLLEALYGASSPYPAQVWEHLVASKPFTLGIGNEETDHIIVAPSLPAPASTPKVYAALTVESDFSLTVQLSLNASTFATKPGGPSAYNETVKLQSIPTYDNAGHLTRMQWEAPLITKSGDKR
ncbi:MAG: hypothetical protein RSA89_02360 [Raoultibacter sp.]